MSATIIYLGVAFTACSIKDFAESLFLVKYVYGRKIIKTVAVIKTDLNKKRFIISEAQWNLLKSDSVQHSIYLVSRQGENMSQVVIEDLRQRIRDGNTRAVPGVIYY